MIGLFWWADCYGMAGTLYCGCGLLVGWVWCCISLFVVLYVGSDALLFCLVYVAGFSFVVGGFVWFVVIMVG